MCTIKFIKDSQRFAGQPLISLQSRKKLIGQSKAIKLNLTGFQIKEVKQGSV